jgi:hypothetical protein
MYLNNTTGMPRPRIMRTFLCGVLSTERECDTNLKVKGHCDVKGWDTTSEVPTLCGTAETYCMHLTTTTHFVYVSLNHVQYSLTKVELRKNKF